MHDFSDNELICSPVKYANSNKQVVDGKRLFIAKSHYSIRKQVRLVEHSEGGNKEGHRSESGHRRRRTEEEGPGLFTFKSCRYICRQFGQFSLHDDLV